MQGAFSFAKRSSQLSEVHLYELKHGIDQNRFIEIVWNRMWTV